MDIAGGYLAVTLRSANESIISGARAIQQLEKENESLKRDLSRARYLLMEAGNLYVSDYGLSDKINDFLGTMPCPKPVGE
jgi:hypothetical protein